MAFSRSVLSVLLLCVVCKATHVPVILWGDLAAPNLKSSPISLTTGDEFSDIVTNELSQKYFTVVFVEETLSNEDFSRRNAEGKTSFPYLQAHIKRATYLPSVEDALATLNMLADPKKVRHVELTEDGLPNELESSTDEKILFINLKDAKEGESRSDLLRRHNDFIEDTMSTLQEKYTKVVAVYTARFPSWAVPHSRSRRQASNETNDYILDGLRLYAKNIRLVDGNNTYHLQNVASNTTEITNATATTQADVMKTTLVFQESTILLTFNKAGGYWYFTSVTVNPSDTPEEMYPSSDVHAIMGFSYRCGQNITFHHANSSKSLIFEDLKVQPVFETTNYTSPVVFGDSFNCIGFFSAPIWSGLFVVFILLAIMFYGVIMMMDIRTMDRFDDPKGKTITINAGD